MPRPIHVTFPFFYDGGMDEEIEVVIEADVTPPRRERRGYYGSAPAYEDMPAEVEFSVHASDEETFPVDQEFLDYIANNFESDICAQALEEAIRATEPQ